MAYAEAVEDEAHPDRMRAELGSMSGLGGPVRAPVPWLFSKAASVQRAVEAKGYEWVTGDTPTELKEHQCSTWNNATTLRGKLESREARTFVLALVGFAGIFVVLKMVFSSKTDKEHEAKVHFNDSGDNVDAIVEQLGDRIRSHQKGKNGYITYEDDEEIYRIDLENVRGRTRARRDVLGEIDQTSLGRAVQRVEAPKRKYVPPGKRTECADVEHLKGADVQRFAKDVVEVYEGDRQVCQGFRIADGFCVPGHLKLGNFTAKCGSFSQNFTNDGTLFEAGECRETADNLFVVSSTTICSPSSSVLAPRAPADGERVVMIAKRDGQVITEAGSVVGFTYDGVRWNGVTLPGDSCGLIVARSDLRVVGYHNAGTPNYQEFIAMPDFR